MKFFLLKIEFVNFKYIYHNLYFLMSKNIIIIDIEIDIDIKISNLNLIY